MPGKQGRDDEGAFRYMVRDLELQVHGSDLRGREDVRVVIAIARPALRCTALVRQLVTASAGKPHRAA